MAAWALVVAIAFWWFEYRHWRQFSDAPIVFSAAALHPLYSRLATNPGRPLLVHFVRNDCPCNRYQAAHIQTLQASLEGIQQVYLYGDEPDLQDLHIPAVPSVALWDGKGEVAYFGPYSSGAVCGAGTDFVRQVVNAVRDNRNPSLVNTLGIGCYCDWKGELNG